MSTSNFLPTTYQQYIHLSRYSRWLWDEKRRETWTETVARYFDFFENHLKENHNYTLGSDRKMLEEEVLSLSVMPSMRCLMTAGPALERDNIAGYNCAYIPVDTARSFDEILHILMNGTGIGFSVERQYINKLPEIAEDFHHTDTTIVIPDSKLGWAKSFKELVHLLYGGQIPKWDLSKLRPAGAVLKTFGGRASGPEPLNDLFNFTVRIFQAAAGRKLTSLECYDIVSKTAEVVVVGGVRRSALISLSNLSDDRMRNAKQGQWWTIDPQRKLTNNSAVYTERPDIEIFLDEWKSLIESKSGERGIFSRDAANKHLLRNVPRREAGYDWGANPCCEIILRPREFCNLSEVVVRPEDDLEILKAKVLFATILGTMQSTLTNFRYLSNRWKKNCEEERLLGVSLTGIMDNSLMNGSKGMKRLKEALKELKLIAIETNKLWASRFGINPSVAITTVKPSGTVSQLVNAAAGIHTRHSEYYIRNVRADKKDPLAHMMKDYGFPCEDDVQFPTANYVFAFPLKAPPKAITRKDMTAIQQLELWLVYAQHWAEHKPSITVTIKPDEWLDVAAFVYRHFDYMSGISFLPFSDHVYEQMPYDDCTKEEYNEALKLIPKDFDWSVLNAYENTDHTEGAQELACSSGVCEI
tara:strand:+ start:6869 stop:8791 length:1923 start_codon:yes stop_codon:yes gene_type:complete